MIEISCAYQHRLRKSPPTCYVLHNTGSDKTKEAIDYYRTNKHGITPHFAVAPDGEIYHLVDISRIAYHVAVSDEQRSAYAGDWAKSPPAWWRERWPTVRSPLDLATGLAPNGTSIGVELIGHGGKHTEAQYVTLVRLLLDLRRDGGPLISRETLLSHSDVNPLARSNSRGPTDPGPAFDWARVRRDLGIPDENQDLRDDRPPVPLAGDGATSGDLDDAEARQGP